MDRRTWLTKLRRENEAQENALSSVFDERWGGVEETHRSYLELFLSMLPPDGDVLDAACGTGKYFGIVLESGRHVTGTDHSDGHMSIAREKFPQAEIEKFDLQDLPYHERFDGVMCIDAMEFVPPEDWLIVLGNFRSALRPDGWLYLTVELVPADEVRAANEAGRRSGLPVVDGEVIWDDPDGAYYHHYPSVQQVRSWLNDARFEIVEETEGPWDEGYAYHHILSRT